jgi:hypothetical protein
MGSPGLSAPSSTVLMVIVRDGEPFGSICVRTGFDAVVLTFPCEQRVLIVRAPCHFGGRRWFCCAGCSGGRYCGRRVAKLWRCHGLAYASQQQNPRNRRINRARAIRMKSGGAPRRVDPFPDKPLGMHWRTYERLRAVERSCSGCSGRCRSAAPAPQPRVHARGPDRATASRQACLPRRQRLPVLWAA